MSLVRCEHPHDVGQPHALSGQCVWPHLVGPSGPPPRPVGHPLTPHD